MTLENPIKGVFLASLTAFLWGILAIALKVILYDLPPLTVTWFRFALAFIFLLIYYVFTDRNKISIVLKPPGKAIIAALFLGLNYIGFIIGVQYTTPVMAQLFIQIGPVLLALSGFILFHEKISVRQGIGLIIVLIGLFVFYHEKILLGKGINLIRTGVYWLIFGAIAWAGYAIFQKKAVVKHDPMQLNLILFGLPAILLLPFVSFNLFDQLSINQWLILLFLGLNTLVAYVALSYALKYLEANKISVIITLNPIITITLMFFLSNSHVSWIEPESYSILTITGAVVLLSGVILTVLNGNSKRIE